MNDTLSDLITRIRNGQLANRLEIFVLKTKISILFLDILMKEGFIRGYRFSTDQSHHIVVLLKYYQNQPTIRKIKRISTPSTRIYANLNTLWKLQNGFGSLILSTTKGLMTDETARRLQIGGEVLAYIE